MLIVQHCARCQFVCSLRRRQRERARKAICKMRLAQEQSSRPRYYDWPIFWLEVALDYY